MQVKTIEVATDGSGVFSDTRPFVGVILAIKVSVGTLETLDLDISDGEIAERDLLNLAGVTADTMVQPLVMGQDFQGNVLTSDGSLVPPAVVGSIKLDVTNATPNGTGSVRFVLV